MDNPEACYDCKDLVWTSVSLRCAIHSICRDCLVKRARTLRNEALNCGKCTPQGTTEATSPPGIWVFVDDSNIWIEAKKLKSKLKGFTTREDHRVRIDMGKLASVIAGDRYVESGILYAAEPPPIADVWRNIETKAGWYVDRSERGRRLRGKNEKQIDAKLVADATATAIVTPLPQRTTMVFVTGDANVLPALKKIVRQEGWTIEIYMWSQSISNSLLEFAEEESQSDRVKIMPLDSYLDTISFSKNELDVVLGKGKKNLQQWRHRQLAKPHGIVFTMKPGAFSHGNVSKEWIENLEVITKWPLQYYWFIEGKEKTNDLVVIFKRDVLAGADFDLDHFMSIADSQLHMGNIPHVIQIQTFREFISKKHLKKPDEELKMWDEAMEQCSICSNDSSINDDFRASDSDSSNASNKSDFKQVKRKYRRSKQRYTKSCPFKKNCINGIKCHNFHSEDDKIYFRNNKDGQGNPFRKTAMCTRFEKRIPCNKDDCEFAHGIDDAWCMNCLQIGHFTVSCPEPRRTSKRSVK